MKPLILAIILFSLFVMIFAFQRNKGHIQSTSNNKPIKSKLISGQYGDLSIVIDANNRVTGVYDLYIDEMRTNEFYFSGVADKSDTINVKLYSDSKLTGQLVYKDSAITFKLSDEPDGYDYIDWVKDGLKTKLSQVRKDWLQIRVVEAKKARLFDSADSSRPRKGYLVDYNFVKIVQFSNGWVKVEYDPETRNAVTYGWIKEDELFPVDPDKW